MIFGMFPMLRRSLTIAWRIRSFGTGGSKESKRYRVNIPVGREVVMIRFWIPTFEVGMPRRSLSWSRLVLVGTKYKPGLQRHAMKWQSSSESISTVSTFAYHLFFQHSDAVSYLLMRCWAGRCDVVRRGIVKKPHLSVCQGNCLRIFSYWACLLIICYLTPTRASRYTWNFKERSGQ